MQKACKAILGCLNFHWLGIRFAVQGAWGGIGIVTTIFPLVFAFLIDNPPTWISATLLTNLNAMGGWKIPVLFGLICLLIRFIYAPYKFYKEEESEKNRLEDYIKPQLRIECGASVPGSVVPTSLGTERACTYFRAVVISKSMKAIPKCTGFITSIKKGEETIMGYESVQLTFAPGYEADALSKRIHPRVPAYLDIIAVPERGDILFCTKQFLVPFSIGGKIFKEPGTYIIKIVVSGKGIAPVSATLIFEWSGNRDKSKLSKA